MVYFFSKAEKSNSLALTDCVNAFFLGKQEFWSWDKKPVSLLVNVFFVVFSLFPSPEFSCVRWVGKCLMKKIDWVPQALFYLLQGYVSNIPIVELFNCSSFLLWCRCRCDSFFQSSCVLSMIMFFSFSAVYLFDDLTAKEDSSVRLNLHESFSAASQL